MSEEISNIKNELSPMWTLPWARKDEILKNVYELMRGKGIMKKSKVMIKTSTLLFASKTSTLCRGIPIPFQHRWEMIIPVIKGSYLTISESWLVVIRFKPFYFRLMLIRLMYSCEYYNNTQLLIVLNVTFDLNLHHCEFYLYIYIFNLK